MMMLFARGWLGSHHPARGCAWDSMGPPHAVCLIHCMKMTICIDGADDDDVTRVTDCEPIIMHVPVGLHGVSHAGYLIHCMKVTIYIDGENDDEFARA